jgi:hypothetical protein
MRKAFGIVLGCTLLCGLVMAAMLAVPPPEPKPWIIEINLNPETEGVNIPWFEVSYADREVTTLQWINKTPSHCSVLFGGDTPIVDKDNKEVHAIPLNRDQASESCKATNVPPPPPPERVPSNGIYKLYKYTVRCGSVEIDPGGGVRP